MICIWIFSCLKYIKCTINRFPGKMLRAVSYIHSFLLSFWIQTCARELMFAGTNTSMLQHLMLYRFRNYVAIYSVIVLLKYHVPMLNVFSNKTNLSIFRYPMKSKSSKRIFYIIKMALPDSLYEYRIKYTAIYLILLHRIYISSCNLYFCIIHR